MKRFLAVFLSFIVFSVIGGKLAFGFVSEEFKPVDFASGRLLVKFKDSINSDGQLLLLKRYNLEQLAILKKLDYRIVKVKPGSEYSLIQKLKANPLIDKVELDGIAEAFITTNDPLILQQWGLFKSKFTDSSGISAWDINKGSAEVKIAILDTGIDQNHEDLASKIVVNQNFTSSPTVDDLYGHGTHVAGIAAAITDNNIGVAGSGYNSSLMNVKVLDDRGSGYYSWVANGIIWAADNGAKVINMSLGGPTPSSLLEDAINYAWNKGVVVVAAAGNSGVDDPSYPAYYTNAIAVAATDSDDSKASWSNYGNWVDVAAPGVSIYSTLPNHTNKLKKKNYGSLSGTSMATPHVAGLAGLIWASSLCLDNNCVRNRIESMSDAIAGTGLYWKFGRINAFNSLGGVIPPQYYTLEVVKNGTGSGSVVSEPSGIDCGLDCTEPYLEGSVVTLTATVVSGSIFAGWAGDCTGNELTCTLTLNSNSQVTATFNDINSPSATSLLVKSIDYVMYGGARNNRNIDVTISVVDDLGNPVSGAKTSILLTNTTWGISWMGSGMTNSDGKVTFTLKNAFSGCYTTTVTELVKSSLTWNNITPPNGICK